jgi:hypothetical protein
MQLSIMKSRRFAFIGANEETCLRIQLKLSKKMDEQKLPCAINLSSLPKNMMMLIVPLCEVLTAMALAYIDKEKLE